MFERIGTPTRGSHTQRSRRRSRCEFWTCLLTLSHVYSSILMPEARPDAAAGSPGGGNFRWPLSYYIVTSWQNSQMIIIHDRVSLTLSQSSLPPAWSPAPAPGDACRRARFGLPCFTARAALGWRLLASSPRSLTDSLQRGDGRIESSHRLRVSAARQRPVPVGR